jgi:uncharacterized protein YjbI with pentapeptide repeats
MANKVHLTLLGQGTDAWNKWRKTNHEIKPDLSGADLRRADLLEADLSSANLSGADLSGADLSWADLSGADLSGANLYGAILEEAELSGISLSGAILAMAILPDANLSGARLSEVRLGGANLIGANLIGADLSWADLSWSSLNWANLSGANLSGANLSYAHTSQTCFEGATFTGACIEDWNYNRDTNLNNVICDFVYLEEGEQERRPHDSNKNFAPGEFTKLFQKALETVDLIFSNGIDWQGFLSSFQKLQIECGSDELFIQSFENKGDDTFVIKVNVPYDADKAEIEKYLKKQYQLEAQLEAKSEQLANLYEITKLLASKPINVEAKAMAENQSSSETFNTDLREANVANFANKLQDNARQQANQHNYAPEQKQTLAEAAAEIQQLLTQLQSQGCSPEKAQQQAANDLATKAKEDPTTLGKLVKWGQSLGDTAAQTTVSEAAKEVVKLALRLSCVPLP